jgi:hypothetical protein
MNRGPNFGGGRNRLEAVPKSQEEILVLISTKICPTVRAKHTHTIFVLEV